VAPDDRGADRRWRSTARAGCWPTFVTVTESAGGRGGATTEPEDASGRSGTKRCRWCARSFELTPGPGRPKEYCRRSCRQRDYEARRRATDAGLGDGQLVVARADLDALHDKLYELEAAIEDVDQDLAASEAPGEREYREALAWVLSVARPLTALRFGDQAR